MAAEVYIQREDFSLEEEWRALRAQVGGKAGGVAAFLGLVRDVHGAGETALRLEHYPGMTERSIERILAAAQRRWQLVAVRVIHRVGCLQPADQIVLTLAAAAHRAEAFAACEFIMDFLKTEAVFWKKESQGGRGRWVQVGQRDRERAASWETAPL